jgi:hypothetical protein
MLRAFIPEELLILVINYYPNGVSGEKAYLALNTAD